MKDIIRRIKLSRLELYEQFFIKELFNSEKTINNEYIIFKKKNELLLKYEIKNKNLFFNNDFINNIATYISTNRYLDIVLVLEELSEKYLNLIGDVFAIDSK